ncbi:hypothetical protein FHY18_002728 [Xanthomonas arboricola]|nr:hypothetical protein [Xanthomonas sp. 3793]
MRNKLQRLILQGPFWQVDAAKWRRQEHDAGLLNANSLHLGGREDDKLNGPRCLAVLQQNRVSDLDW